MSKPQTSAFDLSCSRRILILCSSLFTRKENNLGLVYTLSYKTTWKQIRNFQLADELTLGELTMHLLSVRHRVKI